MSADALKARQGKDVADFDVRIAHTSVKTGAHEGGVASRAIVGDVLLAVRDVAVAVAGAAANVCAGITQVDVRNRWNCVALCWGLRLRGPLHLG